MTSQGCTWQKCLTAYHFRAHSLALAGSAHTQFACSDKQVLIVSGQLDLAALTETRFQRGLSYRRTAAKWTLCARRGKWTYWMNTTVTYWSSVGMRTTRS